MKARLDTDLFLLSSLYPPKCLTLHLYIRCPKVSIHAIDVVPSRTSSLFPASQRKDTRYGKYGRGERSKPLQGTNRLGDRVPLLFLLSHRTFSRKEEVRELSQGK